MRASYYIGVFSILGRYYTSFLVFTVHIKMANTCRCHILVFTKLYNVKKIDTSIVRFLYIDKNITNHYYALIQFCFFHPDDLPLA